MAQVRSPILMSSVASVVVNVVNQNDVSPVILNSGTSVNISEFQLVQSLVFKIVATDADGDTLTYSITSGSDGKFATNNEKIMLVGALDFDIKMLYVLTVAVTDGKFTTTGTIQVNVIAVARPPPKFNQPIYIVTVSENSPI